MKTAQGAHTVFANNEVPIAPLGRQYSLRESVTESLRTAIIAGTLKEGTMYSAPALAAAFGVSATPVREAMMDLTREGLVETMKNKGFRITSMSDRELDEITEIRLLLEPPVMADIAGTIPPSGIAALRSMADAIVDAAREGDLTSTWPLTAISMPSFYVSPATTSSLSSRRVFACAPGCTVSKR